MRRGFADWKACRDSDAPIPAAFGLQPVAEAPNVAHGAPSGLASCPLRELVFNDLADHMDPPQFAPTHHDSVLSDHPALLVRAGSL